MGREGSGIRQVSETSIQIEFLYQGQRCRERIKFNPSTTPANIAVKKAALHRAAILHAIDKGTFDYATTFPESKHIAKFQESSELTVGKWLDQWIDKKEPHLKVSTIVGYKKEIVKIVAKFGAIKLTDLKKKDVKKWCESLDVTNKTIANILSPLRAALQDAVDEDLIQFNPLSGFQFKRNEGPRTSDIDPFTPEEREAIIQATRFGHARNLFKFAFWTGLRTSEMVALEWKDINWERGVIRVDRAKTTYAKSPESTKTKAGQREVKILAPTLEALEEQKKLTGKAGKHVFLNPFDEKPWRGDSPIRKVWKSALRKSGIRYRRPYQTRHTFASMMLSAGEPLAWVSKQLGHSSVIVTANTYARWIPHAQADVGNKAVAIFS